MNAFLLTMASFPTAIWSTALVVLVLYWLLVAIGMLDLDLGGVELDFDLDSDAQLSGIAGLMATFGLTGVPIPVVVTLLLANGWIVSYFASLLLVPDMVFIGFLIGVAVLLGSVVVAVPVTSLQIKPLRKLFQASVRKPLHLAVQGATCQVRSSRCDAEFGEATVSYEGASLVVKIRSLQEEFKRGDQVVIINHDADANVYHVVSEAKFSQETV